VAVSVDLFGTLVTVDRPGDAAATIATELDARGVTVPDDWSQRYRTRHVDIEPSREYPLGAHVRDALAAAGIDADRSTADAAVWAAFDPESASIAPREDILDAITAVSAQRPVGVLSNCSVPGLVENTLDRAGIDRAAFDAVLSSVEIGWRKPAPAAFEAIAGELDTAPGALVHVGDDPDTDGGITRVGGKFVDVTTCSPARLQARLGGST